MGFLYELVISVLSFIIRVLKLKNILAGRVLVCMYIHSSMYTYTYNMYTHIFRTVHTIHPYIHTPYTLTLTSSGLY